MRLEGKAQTAKRVDVLAQRPRYYAVDGRPLTNAPVALHRPVVARRKQAPSASLNASGGAILQMERAKLG